MAVRTEPLQAFPAPSGRSGFLWDAYKRMRRNRAAMISMVVIGMLVVTAIFADLVAPYSPSEQFLKSSGGVVENPLAPRRTGKFERPTADHVFGTDQLARDIFSRTVVGLRISLSAAFFAIVVVTVIGVVVGTFAASGSKSFDDLLMRVTDITYAFPDLLFIILLRSVFADSLFGFKSVLGIEASVLLLFLAISLTAWPTMARIIRGQLLTIREMEYTIAARALGARQSRIAVRHWLPNAVGPAIVEATFLAPRAIFAEAALSFIGIGVNPPTPSLGVLISEHFSWLQINWTGVAFPTATLAVLFLAFQFFGDGLRDAFDPRSRR
ncbi:MAG: ABC transporter permease [Chloroflexi bacterium]|nr:ABC transporter permease [Chloroflexota bacterium]